MHGGQVESFGRRQTGTWTYFYSWQVTVWASIGVTSDLNVPTFIHCCFTHTRKSVYGLLKYGIIEWSLLKQTRFTLLIPMFCLHVRVYRVLFHVVLFYDLVHRRSHIGDPYAYIYQEEDTYTYIYKVYAYTLIFYFSEMCGPTIRTFNPVMNSTMLCRCLTYLLLVNMLWRLPLLSGWPSAVRQL